MFLDATFFTLVPAKITPATMLDGNMGMFQEVEANLTWVNVGIALTFIIFDVGVSTVFRLGVGSSLMIAALRCMGQLAVVATLLQKVFESKNPWVVALIAFVLNFLGTFETVVNKSQRRFQHMFPAVLVALLGSTIPVSIIGTRFAMSVEPFWTPIQYIPIVGMLCGATISSIVVSVSYILKELTENRDKVEVYLAFGATRTEACRPIVIEALRLALTPPINNMSVLGIIAIPGMMTGAILGGSSVQQAARLQMIIMFMISASSVLASILTTFSAVSAVVDKQHRIRSDRIDSRPHVVWRFREWGVGTLFGKFKKLIGFANEKVKCENSGVGERQRLLG